jgi:putative redox protein
MFAYRITHYVKILALEILMAGMTSKATVKWIGDEVFVGTPPSGHAVVLDTKGDSKTAPSPVEMLLLAVAACSASDVISILLKKRQVVSEYVVEVSGDRADEHPRKFVKMHVHHIVHGRSVSAKALADAIKLSDDKYCSVAATVRPTATITTSYEIVESERQAFISA